MATAIPDVRCGWLRTSLLSLFLFCLGSSPAVAADPATYTYRTRANEVRLTFSVTDQNDHAVATLQASDFAVVDRDIIVRNFQSFSRSDWTKLEIAILVDASGSAKPYFREELAQLLDLVSRTAGIPEQNVSIFSFRGLQPVLICAGDCRVSHAVERIPGARAGDLTPLFDTIIYASQFLSSRADAHAEKVLVLLSDGTDTISRHSLREAMDAALRDEVQIECVDLNKSSTSSAGRSVLQGMASASGGRYFASPKTAMDAMDLILESFRATYRVSYRLPILASGFHAVRILPTHSIKLQFRSRSGYYFPE